jgi:C-terminal, D2-small domain, of ClpB protein
MSHLTAAADLAWRMAATEAGSSGHVWIERAHLLVGILSLEKVTTEKADALKIDPSDLVSVRAERASLAELLAGLTLDAADLRRAARRALGEGPGAPKGAISRSDDCKAAFARAAALGREAPVSALLLLAALAESPDPVLKQLLAERGVEVAALVKRARAFGGVSAAEVLVPPPGPAPAAAAAAPELDEGASPMLEAEGTRRIARPLLDALCREVRERYGVALRIEPEAEAFVARAGLDAERGAHELRRSIERLVEAPLTSLARSGKLARHPAWRATYEEGGVYVIPDEG